MNIAEVINRVCLVKVFANHLCGKDHKLYHRGIIGIGIMLIGVSIAKATGHSDVHFITLVGDTVGYGLHGIGLIPFIEALIAEV